MGFRTLEISCSAEIHIKRNQLEVATDEGTILIPIEDLNQIMVHGANIRLSIFDILKIIPISVEVRTYDSLFWI